MSDPVAPARDLFDEPRAEPARHVGAIAPLVRTGPGAETRPPPVPLHWRRAGVALVVGAGVAAISRFPLIAVAALALFSGGMSLWPLPRWAGRLWLVVAASFFFAQATTIFVNAPFTWPMRFVFCAVLLLAVALLRVDGGE